MEKILVVDDEKLIVKGIYSKGCWIVFAFI